MDIRHRPLAAIIALGLAGSIVGQEPKPVPKLESLRTDAQTAKPMADSPDPAGGAAKAFESVEAFMDSIRGEVWEKIGTYNVRRVRYDTAGQDVLDYENSWTHTNPDTRLLDPGVVCVTYRGQSSSWSFFLPDGVHAVTCRVHEWQECQPHPYVKGTKPWHPEDIWKIDETFEYPYLRLTDGTVELQKELSERPTVLPAWEVTSRVSEFTLPDGRVYWAAESSDGTKLWLLKILHVFGARLCEGPRVTGVPLDAPAFMEEREKRMMDFVNQLHSRKLDREALALERELVRRMGRYHGPGSAEERLMMGLYPQGR